MKNKFLTFGFLATAFLSCGVLAGISAGQAKSIETKAATSGEFWVPVTNMKYFPTETRVMFAAKCAYTWYRLDDLSGNITGKNASVSFTPTTYATADGDVLESPINNDSRFFYLYGGGSPWYEDNSTTKYIVYKTNGTHYRTHRGTTCGWEIDKLPYYNIFANGKASGACDGNTAYTIDSNGYPVNVGAADSGLALNLPIYAFKESSSASPFFVISSTEAANKYNSPYYSYQAKLYAKVDSYNTVTLDDNGGSGGSGSVKAFKYTKLKNVSVPSDGIVGHRFDGYYTAASGGTQIINSNGVCVTAYDGSYTKLYAHYSEITYTITYNKGKNAQFGSNYIQTVKYSDSTFTTRVLTYTHKSTGTYIQAGWSTSSSESTRDYELGTEYTNTHSDFMVYPYWAKRAQTITFDQQSGTGGTESIGATYNESVPNITVPTRTGYTFGGYYTAVNGGGTQYYNSSGTGVHNLTMDNLTLYAKWTPKTYNLALDLKGGTGGTTFVNPTYDAEMPAITIPTKTGYTFGGYFDGNNGTGTQYYNADGTSAIIWTFDYGTTVYAYWIALATDITFDANDGTGGPSSGTATYDAAMPKILVLPTRTGYTFDGYYDAKTGGTKYYNSDGTSARSWDKVDKKVTLYAQWKVKQTAITFDKNDGTGGTTNTTATYGAAMPAITLPSRTGYNFLGYFDSKTGDNQYYSSTGASLKTWDKEDEKVTLYAHWSGKEYTVTLNKNDGSGTTSTKTVTYGSAMPTVTAPTRTGYTFTGYFDASSGGVQYINSDGTSAKNWDKTSNTTLYAQWTGNTYTVTLNKNDGSSTTSTKTVTYGSAMPTVTAPTRTGYTFTGYFDASSGGVQYINSDGTSAKNWDKTSDTTLYAQWSAKKFTVTLNKQSGTGGTSSVTAVYDADMPAITLPTRSSYIFFGYFSGTSGTGTKYYNADGSSAIKFTGTAAMTLYAYWRTEEAVGKEQAEVFAVFFIKKTNGYCSATLSSTVISEIQAEWNKLPGYAKTQFSNTTVVEGKGKEYKDTIQEAYSRYYNMIVEKNYSDFLSIGVSKANVINNTNTIGAVEIVTLVSVLTLLTGSAVMVFLKKRKYSN